jgi:hypothetical protein
MDLWLIKPKFYGKTNTKIWGDFITGDVANFCINEKIDLVIIDTISRFWPVANENDASQTNAALLPLEKLKDLNIALFIIQQSNKQGGSFTNAIRGSTEIGGWADETLVFGRLESEHKKSHRRQIDFLGRLYDSEDRLIIRLGFDNKYIAEGNRYQVSKQARLDATIIVFTNIDSPLTIKEFRDHWNEEEYGSIPSNDSIQRYINDLVAVSKLRLVDEVIIVKRKVQRYGLFDKSYVEQLTATSTPPTLPAAVSSDNNSTHRSSMGGRNNFAVSSDNNKPFVGHSLDEGGY